MKKGIFLAALSGILYGSLGYFGHVLKENGLSITEICLWRFVFSTLCFIPVIPFYFKQKVQWKALLLPFFLGGICYSSSCYLYFSACPYIGSGLAMVIFFTYPILVVLISSFLHKTLPSLISLISSFLILVGCALIAYQKGMQLDYFGVGLSLLSALGYGVYVALSKNIGKPVPPLLGTLAVCLGNAAAYSCLMPFTEGSFAIPTNPEVIFHLTLFGFFGTFLPVLLMLHSLKYISANTAAIISVSEPVTTLAVGFFILSEDVSSVQFAGALVILGAALLTVLFNREKRSVEAFSAEQPTS